MTVLAYPRLKCRHGLRARLLLADGLRVEGCGFGAPGVKVGEVVFSTSMTGYPESLTDPSYRGQILIYTHPMIGNYGVPSTAHAIHDIPANYESNVIHVEGFIIAELSKPHHYLSTKTLHEWLRENSVPGMYRVDTRALVKRIREYGVMMGVLAVYNEREEITWDELEQLLEKSPKYDETNFAYKVSPKEPIEHHPIGVKPIGVVNVLDCGIKYGILRWLLRKGFIVRRLPCWSKPEQVVEEANGILLSNGPGNPALLSEVIGNIREVVEYRIPILAICLGMQLLALAFGAKTYKLPYGHRGPNKPVVDISDNRCYITTQNHGYAVDQRSLEETGLKLWFINPDDKSVEGYLHPSTPIIATQFHPEGGPGPHDTSWVFDMFRNMVVKYGR